MLEVNNLSYSYIKDKPVVNNVSFNLKDKDFLSIIGPNGSGKTTLLKTIAQLIKGKGEIKFNNENISSLSRREIAKKITYFSQNRNGLHSLSVYDTVMLGRYPYISGFLKKPSNKDKEIVLNSLSKVGLIDHINTNINCLSGGQVQRVFLAQIISQDSDVILLDEPTNHLDIKHQVSLLKHIKEYAQNNNKIVISVFHDLTIAKKYSNKILLLSEGKSHYFGNKNDVFNQEKTNQIYEINIKNHMYENYKEWTIWKVLWYKVQHQM